MSTISTEQAKDLRNAFECWQQDYDPVEDKEQYEMFGLGVVAMDELLALRKEREKEESAVCPKCGNTGLADSGGVQPWGEPILIDCDCRYTSTTLETDTTAQQFESLAGKAVVPAGWKLVPIEPTVEMQIAFAEAWFSKVRCVDDCELEDAYIAMLAAAPEPCK
ncbi:hypothetical protein SNO00_003557 [Cronobacter sakazakii]|nr:hypothetical protein [Cronobacter sakazakii]